MSNIKKILPIIFIITLVFGCGLQSANVPSKNYANMSWEEKEAYFMGIYNSQYDNYVLQTKAIPLDEMNEEQRNILRTKHGYLTKMYRILLEWDIILNSGNAFPSEESEQELLRLIDSLTIKGGGS